MTGSTSSSDLFQAQVQPKGSLNTLTILTFIGCGLAYIGALYSFFKAGSYEDDIAKMEDMRDRSSGTAARLMEESMQLAQKSHDYRYILFLSGLLFTTLCLIGALQMRKLKKSGYPLYVVGEIAPIILSIVLLGLGSMVMKITIGFSIVIAILFVALYSAQRKYMVN